MRNLRAPKRDSVVPNKGAGRSWGGALCRLLDRTPSERSEDKLVFLINDQPVELCLRAFKRLSVQEDDRTVPLPSGWALMMRAIKCLKGIRWMPWR